VSYLEDNKENVYFNNDANLFWGVIEHFRHSDNNRLCIDIGTFYGGYAERYVSLFENVVCFEANYYIEKDLRNRMAKTKHDNYKIYMNGLGKPEDHNTEKLFYAVTWAPPHNTRWSGISSYKSDHFTNWPEKEVNITEITTTVRTLDSYNLAPSFIKMDVENSESDVIMGGIETISKHKPTLQVEGKGSIELIKSLGYRLVAQRKCHGALHDNIYVYGQM